jgi:predicted nucleotidyltransferase
MTHPAVDFLLEQLKVFPEVQQIILFGSRARGDNTPYSDIDIGVVCPTITPRKLD